MKISGIVSAISAVFLLSFPVGAQEFRTITDTDVEKTLKTLTLEQKARLIVGSDPSSESPSHTTAGAAGWTYAIKQLGIPSLNLADGPVGPRINPMPWIEVELIYDDNGIPVAEKATTASGSQSRPASEGLWCTAFPSTTALAASFDREAARAQGEAMGDEARAYGVDVLLTPGVNIMRNPLCGRNFEYYSEDPYLTGALATEVIRGIQDKGVGTSLKHFVANNQQTGKKYNDARINRRALREIYLKPFEMCVRDARPWTVMPSYNKIGGRFTQTNRELMQTLLRDEWGFRGAAVTDWFVRRPTADLIRARVGLIMPGAPDIVDEVVECVRSGAVSEAELDSCVADVLRLASRSISAKGWTRTNPDLKSNAALSRHIAAEAMVLLKNNDKTLPVAPGARIALFGTSAYQSLPGGTGSSNVNKAYVVDIDRGLAEAGYRIDESLASVYREFNSSQARLNDSHPDCPEWQKISYHRPVIREMDLSRASHLIGTRARTDDAAVVVVGRESGETSDRVVPNDFNLSEAEKLMISSVCKEFHAQGKPVIVVLNVCGVIETASWREQPDAILLAWFPGQECGHAVADVLSGAVNPSGRLPMTFPLHYADTPSAYNYPRVGQTEGRNFDYTNYEEDIWVGYRYFDKSGRKVSYPFGYGLSYTDFEYSKPKVIRRGDKTTVSVEVRNTGSVPGREVVQLYVSAPESAAMVMPVAELRGFAKTRTLAPGECQKVEISVSDRDLASFDEDKSAWVTAAGEYTARIGRHAGEYIVSLPFKVAKTTERKVSDILAPVAPVKKIEPKPDPFADIVWHKGTDFPILGRVYPDSLPLYSRVPAFRKKGTREALYSLGQHSSGMAIRFRTNSPKIALRWESLYRNDMTHMASMASRGADLYYLNDKGQWRFLAPARPVYDPTTTMIIENMDPEMHEYMLHLPLYDGVKWLEIGVADGSVIENPVVDSPSKSRKPVVIYGSSIQHGATASRPGMAASNILRRDLDTDVINLGFSANAHLDYEVAEMMADVDASVYVLDFVPNALVWEINDKTEKFVKILRDRRPDVPLIFIEDPIFTHAQLDRKIAATIRAKNEAIKAMYEKMVAEGMTNTYYVPTEAIVPADGDGSSDSVHFTDRAYRTYCDALLPILRNILK